MILSVLSINKFLDVFIQLAALVIDSHTSFLKYFNSQLQAVLVYMKYTVNFDSGAPS